MKFKVEMLVDVACIPDVEGGWDIATTTDAALVVIQAMRDLYQNGYGDPCISFEFHEDAVTASLCK